MAATPVDKRNFYLALSVSDGQALANSVGFAIPSAEVQQNEMIDTVQKWMTLAAVGLVDQVQECTDWMAEALKRFQGHELSEVEIENIKTILACYSVALLCNLIDNEYITLSVQEEAELDVGRIDRLLAFLGADDDVHIVFDNVDPTGEDDSDE